MNKTLSIFCVTLIMLIFSKTRVFASDTSMYIHVPISGDEICFYPISDALKSIEKGYDCFYVTQAYNGHKLCEKSKFRFMKDSNEYTPFCEIENKTFKVIDSFKYAPTSKSKDARYVVQLQREDGESLYLVIPLEYNANNNAITNSMVIRTVSYNGNSRYINIPYVKISELSAFRKKYEDKEVIGTSSFYDTSENCVINAFSVSSEKTTYKRYLTGVTTILDNRFVTYDSFIAHIRNIHFISVPGFCFKQLVVEVEKKSGSIYKFPYCDFRGNGSQHNFSGRTLDSYIEPSASLYEELYKKNFYMISLNWEILFTMDTKNIFETNCVSKKDPTNQKVKN